jgi:hypothetical protein
MAFYFTVTNLLNNVSVNSPNNIVQVTTTSKPVTLYTNATVVLGGGSGAITSATFTTLTATNIVLHNALQGGGLYPSTIEIQAPSSYTPDGGTIVLQTDGGDVLIQQGDGGGNLYVQGQVHGYNGYYAGSIKVIDNNGNWVGPAISDNPQEEYQTAPGDTSQIQLDRFVGTQFDCAKYFIRMKDNDNHMHIVEIVLAFDGTNIYKSEYGVITSHSALGTFQADYNTGWVRLLFTPTSVAGTSIRIAKTLMAG